MRLTRYGFNKAYGTSIQNKLATVNQKARELKLDGQSLVRLTDSELDIVLQECSSKLKREKADQSDVKNEKKVEKNIRLLREALQEYKFYHRENMSNQDRKDIIRKDRKPAEKCIAEIDQGTYSHFYYLPQAAYLENGIKSAGLVVDLLEIRSLSLDDAERISYKKLWKLLIDKDMKKQDLREAAQLSSSTVAKLTHGENVSTAVLLKICTALQCDIADIMEIVPDGSPASDE